MSTKPTLPSESPGHAALYEVTNVDYNNDVLQNGNYVQQVLAGTNTDKIPTTAIVANPGFAGVMGIGGASAANTNLLQLGTLSPASQAYVNGLNQTLTLKPTLSGGNAIFASVGAAIDTSAAGGAVAGGFGLFVAAVTKTGANAVNTVYGVFISIPTAGTNNVGLAFNTPAGAIQQEAWTAVLGGVGFTNSWTNFGGGNAAAAYFRDTQGIVHLRGTISGGTAIGTTAFTLPVGYRPAANAYFPAVSNSAFGAVLVASSGAVQPAVGSTAWISLEGITFDTR